MKKPSMYRLMRIGMTAFVVACVGVGIGIYADSQDYVQLAQIVMALP